MKMLYHYTYLITDLYPSSTERYYIGVRTCSCHPESDINYMSSSTILKKVIKDGSIFNFEKIIIQSWKSRDLAEIHENELHLKHTVATNPLFYNVKNGVVGFHYNEKAKANQKQTFNNPIWKETVGKESRRKQSATKSSKEWKETVGKEKIKKYKETICKGDILKKRGEKISATKSSKEWKETVGKESSIKRLATFGQSDWKEKVGGKIKKTVNSPEYKQKKLEQIKKQKKTRRLNYLKENLNIAMCVFNLVDKHIPTVKITTELNITYWKFSRLIKYRNEFIEFSNINK